MQLPVTVVFEPPSRAELRALLRMRRAWAAGLLVALAIGTLLVVSVWRVGRTEAVAAGATVPLKLSSRPTAAGVWLDGRERGRTPLEVQVEPGAHDVVFKTTDAPDNRYALQVGADGVALDAVLWSREPLLSRLRPALPGAALTDVRLLADGQLGLSIAVPADHQMQAWRLDPQTGRLEPLLTDITGSRLVVAEDSRRVAFIGYPPGPPEPGTDAAGLGAGRASVVWLVSAADPHSSTGWRPPVAATEQLLDVSWSPSADRLLVVTGQGLAGGAARSRLWLVDAGGQHGREVLTLPSEIAPGSETWSPDGQHVALLAHAGPLNALCLVDVDGGFRYVADLDPSPGMPPAYLPATWAADSQRLLFVAPADQRPPGAPLNWLQADAKHALYVASVGDPTPALAGYTDVDFAAWREDGQVVGLGRQGADHALAIHLLDGSGNAQQLLELPLKPAAGYAAVWDLARARLLVTSPNASGTLDYWLARFGLEGRP